MAQVAQSIDGSLKILRITHSALLLSMGLYIWVAEKIVVHPELVLDRIFSTSIGALAVVTVIAAFVVRRKMIGPALDTLQTKPEDTGSLTRWRAGNIISYALAESTVLFGFVLRMLGAPLTQSAWFYFAGPLLIHVDVLTLPGFSAL
jgi:hypothetical protein